MVNAKLKNRRLGGESDQEIVFVSFVHACERSCVWPRDDVASDAGFRKEAACSDVSCVVPFPSPSQNHSLAVCWLTNRCKSLLIDSKSFRVASRCFSLLPAAFPLRLGWKTANLSIESAIDLTIESANQLARDFTIELSIELTNELTNEVYDRIN